MLDLARLLSILAICSAALTAQSAADDLECWPPAERKRQLALEDALLKNVDPASLSSWHERFASAPHDAGTPGDERMVEMLSECFESLGLEVEKHEIHVLLPRPVAAELEVIAPEHIRLALMERPLAEDPYTTGAGWKDLAFGWNAYSASGEVEAEVVYAHFGRKEDFEKLAELGVDCTGKIVIARYGGNFRGYKAKFAEASGAVGLIIFSDPKDSGYGRGVAYPEGGYANETYIQRGSITTLPYLGDPTTPFVESTADAQRVAVEGLALPKIPVQPIGWGAAREILSRMRGTSVPGDWQGGLPFRYRLTGGEGLRVRLMVEQELKIRKTYNVLGTLRGAVEPEKRIVIGAHHDAWGYGAADSVCGLICVTEAARAWSLAAKAGHPPRRSITFAGWGAEEYGIIGSVEYVESRLADLIENAVCYLNLDMAAMGLRFGCASSPTLRRTIGQAMGRVPQPGDEDGRSVREVWGAKSFGEMGGGSDHVGFIALAGVPSASLGGGGSRGTSYHSAYDTVAWYRQVVGADYASARMVTQAAAVVSARFAGAPLLPIDPARSGSETRRHLKILTTRGRQTGLFDPEDERAIAVELARIEALALQFEQRATRFQQSLYAAQAEGRLTEEDLAQLNRGLQQLDRVWLFEPGIPERPWYRNLYAATDESSGYASWILPALRYAVEHADAAALAEAEPRYRDVFERSSALIEELETSLGARFGTGVRPASSPR